MEREQASKWYRWLWWSPFVTIPTLVFIGGIVFLITWDEGIALPVGFLGSSLWHLILLKPALDQDSKFVRWHGRQALLLAGLQTAVLLGSISGYLNDYFYTNGLCLVAVVIMVWLFGTLWGQNQAKRGDCSLARWFGHADELPCSAPDVESMVKIIRYSRDPEERKKALFKLEELGLVEEL